MRIGVGREQVRATIPEICMVENELEQYVCVCVGVGVGIKYTKFNHQATHFEILNTVPTSSSYVL